MAGVFQPRRRGGAAGHLHEYVDALLQGLVVHQAHAFQTHDIGDFMRVYEHRGGAVGHYRAGELRDGEHAALDMHMRIAQAGEDVAAVRLDHLGIGADHGRGVGAAIGKTAVCDGNIRVFNNFAGMDVHPFALPDNHIGGRAGGGNINEAGGDFGPCFQIRHGRKWHGFDRTIK